MSGNKNLHTSRYDITDEFYTPFSLIEKELKHYENHFRGKTVYCNCDNPYTSNFFKYFVSNFNKLGIRRLYATCYSAAHASNRQLSLFDTAEKVGSSMPYKIEVNHVDNEWLRPPVCSAHLSWMPPVSSDCIIDFNKLLSENRNHLSVLSEDGDFRSLECVEILNQSDIVVTNPPFSLFHQYLMQLIDADKKFLIIGNQNAVTHKEFLDLICTKKMWLGYNNGSARFEVPASEIHNRENYNIGTDGKIYRNIGNICWYTNMDINKRHKELKLTCYYSPEKYPKYDSYDAIEVSKVSEIPCDYYGVMGVPVSFLIYHNPEQFTLLGDSRFHDGKISDINFLNGKNLYRRLLIKRTGKEET